MTGIVAAKRLGGLGSALTIGRTLTQTLRSRWTVEGRTKLVKSFTV
jgi:hypothetical protein